MEKVAVFSTREYLVACGNSQTNRNLLSRAVKKGKVLKIKRGLYASNAGMYQGVTHNKYSIVKAAVPDAVLCYDSAFELFVGQHNIVQRTVFFSATETKSFRFQGHEYLPFPIPVKRMKTRSYRQSDGSVVKGTTPEQTIVDSLVHPNRCLGIENVLRSISVVGSINTQELLGILRGSSTAVTARAGWILVQKQGQWQIPDTVIASLQRNIGSGPLYFTPDHAQAKGSYDKSWKLYFPEPIATMKAWING
jgi:predicted transcriptional regulator of viral defense system